MHHPGRFHLIHYSWKLCAISGELLLHWCWKQHREATQHCGLKCSKNFKGLRSDILKAGNKDSFKHVKERLYLWNLFWKHYIRIYFLKMKVDVMSFGKLMDLQAANCFFFSLRNHLTCGFVPKWHAQFKQKIHINFWQNNTAIKLKPIIGDGIFFSIYYYFLQNVPFHFPVESQITGPIQLWYHIIISLA